MSVTIKGSHRVGVYVESHRAHEVMLGCQQSIQGNSGIIIGASIWLAMWPTTLGNGWPFGKYARKTANGQQFSAQHHYIARLSRKARKLHV